MNRRTLSLIAAAALLSTACVKRVHEEPILENGERVASPDAVAAVAAGAATQAQAVAERRDELTADALTDCAGDVCAAIARGELALGMTARQVLAATRTTEDAWSIRNSGPATVLTPATFTQPPRDVEGDVAMVQMRDGRVSTYSYREHQGVRVVSSPEDATTEGRARAMAETLLRDGDDYAARGDLRNALDRYDRADVLRPGDPLTTYRIATTLDKQLRPIEAQIRYQLFLHQMELEKIEAYGDAYAKLADAIAHARERLIIMEKR